MSFLFDVVCVVFVSVVKNCTETAHCDFLSGETAQKLHTATSFLFGVACVVFGSVFGKLHKNCTKTAQKLHMFLVFCWPE